ncbi:uncharacterized protein N7458_004334 [Penicillium daleae]|uniref:Uncharacterized protein n=1 Tax=Penicillium daleae TaxID=63821 RepID=A0AAD6G5A7_9EURO|nr:uncharacterized protein N7458_004334 [Penicillium daleae]KAJ5456070.1 hypothetical protein N7458_004334 [Penicillium daleae]
MSFLTQLQGFEPAPPSGSANHQDDTNTPIYEQNTFFLIEKLLRQEQLSKYYQGQLESKLYNDSAEYQKLRAHCLQLERVVSGVQQQKSHLEASLAHTAEACRVMARDLGLERTKVQELETRLNELYPAIDSLLQILTPEENKAGLQDKAANGHLLLENQQQQELIAYLQSTLHDREQAVKELRISLDQAIQELRAGDPSQFELGNYTVDGESNGESSEGSCVEIITEKPSSSAEV